MDSEGNYTSISRFIDNMYGIEVLFLCIGAILVVALYSYMSLVGQRQALPL